MCPSQVSTQQDVLVLQAADAMGVVRRQPVQSWRHFWKVATLSTAFLLSVVLGNVALRYIHVSFSQVLSGLQ